MANNASTVTQELELVYWKDIKDSTEPDEFQSFLEKFPAGIYADLARKRLRKLEAPASAGDETVLSGMTMPGTASPDLEATRVPGTASASAGGDDVARSAAPTDAAPTAPTSSTAPDETAVLDEREGRTASTASASADPTAPAGPGIAPAASPNSPPSAPPAGQAAAQPAPASTPTRKQPVAMFAVMGALAVAGLAAVWMFGKSGGKAEDAMASAPVPAASTPAAAASGPASGSVIAATPVGAAPPLAIASAKQVASDAPATAASAPRRPASRAQRAASAPPEAPRQATAAPSSPPPASAPAVAPAEPSAPRATAAREREPAAPNPVEQCRDRMFLSRELCLSEHCDKAASRNHPLCVKHREDVRLREAAKPRQGPQ
ncbi:hypothetical protein [Ramlibacter sp.]|uniref:hypothetical protein n=1 Tax=Ramlibacter sp. TaxID=1917967 RepID=UPI003D145149